MSATREEGFMKTQQIQFKTIQKICQVICLLFLTACTTFEPGDPPPPNEPIIVDPPAVKPAINGGGGISVEKPKEIDSQDAINYMVTSLVTRCQPISGAGKDIPEILNSFTVSNDAVNDLPMEVWQKLVRMKMIKPVSNPKDNYSYSLVSEIESLPNPDSKRKKYLWKMRLLSNSPENKEVWKGFFEFTEEK